MFGALAYQWYVVHFCQSSAADFFRLVPNRVFDLLLNNIEVF